MLLRQIILPIWTPQISPAYLPRSDQRSSISAEQMPAVQQARSSPASPVKSSQVQSSSDQQVQSRPIQPVQSSPATSPDQSRKSSLVQSSQGSQKKIKISDPACGPRATNQAKLLQRNAPSLRLGRSPVEGLGLFAREAIKADTFLCEYVGELIRRPLEDTREQQWQRQGRAHYLFRRDKEWVIDATQRVRAHPWLSELRHASCAIWVTIPKLIEGLEVKSAGLCASNMAKRWPNRRSKPKATWGAAQRAGSCMRAGPAASHLACSCPDLPGIANGQRLAAALMCTWMLRPVQCSSWYT